jgi:hypothetical protein
MVEGNGRAAEGQIKFYAKPLDKEAELNYNTCYRVF